MNESPEGVIVTISRKMMIHGYRHWLINFLDCMRRNAAGEEVYYWLRTSAQLRHDKDVQYVYLCMGNKIRYRAIYAGSRGVETKTFEDGRTLDGRAWIILAGPVERAPHEIKKQGFQGFRYTHKLF